MTGQTYVSCEGEGSRTIAFRVPEIPLGSQHEQAAQLHVQFKRLASDSLKKSLLLGIIQR